jgi:hypothetical protein
MSITRPSLRAPKNTGLHKITWLYNTELSDLTVRRLRIRVLGKYTRVLERE